MRMRFLLAFIASAGMIHAGTAGTKHVSLEYGLDTYCFDYDSSGQLIIHDFFREAGFDFDTNEPMLPYYTVRIALPAGLAYNSFTVTQSTEFVMDNVIVAPNPVTISTNDIYLDETSVAPDYGSVVFPVESVSYVSSLKWGSYKIACFHVRPFQYDAGLKALYIHSKIDIAISTKECDIQLDQRGESLCSLSSFIVNSDEIAELSSQGDAVIAKTALATPPSIDYLIITSPELYSSFNELIDWKKTKGIRSSILTVDSFLGAYSGAATTEKIRNCIKDYKTRFGVRYVLLGGDDTVIPVNYYSIVVNDSIREYPADIYYACFSDDFEYAASGMATNASGEAIDYSEAFYPDVYVTILPVKSPYQASCIVKKIIAYERGDRLDCWRKAFLISGREIFKEYYSGHSDAQIAGLLETQATP